MASEGGPLRRPTNAVATEQELEVEEGVSDVSSCSPMTVLAEREEPGNTRSGGPTQRKRPLASEQNGRETDADRGLSAQSVVSGGRIAKISDGCDSPCMHACTNALHCLLARPPARQA